MKAGKLTGIALATAAAGVFAMTAAGPAAAQAGMVKCAGANSCKGKSDCKSGASSCKGQNSCKGAGFVMMSAADCDKAKAGMKK